MTSPSRSATIISEATGTPAERSAAIEQLRENVVIELINTRLAKGWSSDVESIIAQVATDAIDEFFRKVQRDLLFATDVIAALQSEAERQQAETASTTTKSAYDKMWESARSKTDAEIQAIWDALVDYNADDYYNKTYGITMDEWHIAFMRLWMNGECHMFNHEYKYVHQDNQEYKSINPDMVSKILNPLGTVVDVFGSLLHKVHKTSTVYSTFDYKGNTRYAHNDYEHRLYQKEIGLIFIGMGKWVKTDE